MYKMPGFVGCCEKIIVGAENLLLIHRPFLCQLDSWMGWFGRLFALIQTLERISFCCSLNFLCVLFSSLPP